MARLARHAWLGDMPARPAAACRRPPAAAGLPKAVAAGFAPVGDAFLQHVRACARGRTCAQQRPSRDGRGLREQPLWGAVVLGHHPFGAPRTRDFGTEVRPSECLAPGDTAARHAAGEGGVCNHRSAGVPCIHAVVTMLARTRRPAVRIVRRGGARRRREPCAAGGFKQIHSCANFPLRHTRRGNTSSHVGRQRSGPACHGCA